MQKVQGLKIPEETLGKCRERRVNSSPTYTVLQLRMQHRRSQEQLNEKNLILPLNKTPAFFSEQNGRVGQSQTEDFLKFKGQNGSHKVGPPQMHFSEGPLLECAKQEKKVRLAEDLSVKILHRPGPLELVKKNILPLGSGIQDAVKEEIHLPSSSSDAYSFDDDGTSSSSSCSSTSPDRGFPPSPGPLGHRSPISSNTGLQLDLTRVPEVSRSMMGSITGASSLATSGPMGSLPAHAGSTLPKVPAKASEAGKPPRQKKSKDIKPKVKKLKYHQYVPPDQKAEKSPMTMDAAYSRLLQQQQIFLQLQILNQQQQQQTYCVQTVHPLTTSLSAEQMISFVGSATVGSSTINLSPSAATTTTNPSSTVPSKPELLPAKLDDLTVTELRQQLRKRGLPVSGTKPALLERLKPYQIPCTKPPAAISSASLIAPVLELPTLPVPLAPDGSSPTACTFQTVPSPAAGELAMPESTGAPGVVEGTALLAFKEDQVLQEKQKVIDSLTWKLKQEQKQAEDLRVELEMHQRLKNRHRAEEKLAPGTAFSMELDNPSSSSPTATESQFLYPLQDKAVEESGTSGTRSADNFVVFSPPSCEFPRPDFELPQQITASPSSSGSGVRSLEEELQEAIQKAQLVPSQSIEDILEEPLVCTALEPTDTIEAKPLTVETKPHRAPSPCSQQASPPKRARHNSSVNLLPPLPSLPLLPPPPATILEFPTCGSYDLLSAAQDGFSTVFSLDHLELPLSPDRPQSRIGSSSSSRMTFDPVDWLEALTSGLTSGFGPSSPVGTSIFSTDFIDSLDFNVNRIIDQWSSC
ncbi:MEF2-activating motif and SAP domain-containing transcriptional regulator isoform X2 [Microcaecilia unicolor]|uniref:MEF2-activating motif and SAP domain-containing transcriptional regulator isoform X2 n=1 Tax=Microcaecilia unicolor TaxID=1415580 RepID=A0A6P7XSH7_9AMPH|nr:MEF2-activating motif and SAP domain-containing transcriptional regulator isoform X2 [Microcaecilia unicolor]